jgi:hypothetical protein
VARIKRLTSSIELTSLPRSLKIASALAAIVAVVMLSRLTIFIVDPSRTNDSVLPFSEWEVGHSCLTAYHVAAHVARDVPNVYDLSIYAAPDDDPSRPRKPKMLGPFRVDQYEYPPPFLLLPRALSLLTPDFFQLRILWFALNGIVLLLGLGLVARHLRGDAATMALLLTPFVLGSIATLNTLQKGNVQLAIIAMSMTAVLLIERGRRATGGALLAFVTVAKLYPGLLVVYLVVRKEWRALMWAAAAAALIVAITFVDLGWQPFAAFQNQFSGLMSGEAFPAFRNPGAVAINESVPGLVFKLKLLGMTGLGFPEARLVGTIYMVLAIALTVLLARRAVADDRRPLVWLTILLLATLRSPFLPQAYAPFPAIWLLTLLFATATPDRWRLSSFLIAYLVLNFYVPVDMGLDPRLLAIGSTVPQIVMVALMAAVFRLPSVDSQGAHGRDRRGASGRDDRGEEGTDRERAGRDRQRDGIPEGDPVQL